MRIQQSVIDEIIEKADIVEVIGEYVKLEKKGNDYVWEKMLLWMKIVVGAR